MATEKSTLPTDLQSIKDFGVDQWFKTFDWPISWPEFLDIETDMQQVLKAAISAFPLQKDLITLNFKLYIEYANFVYALLLIERTNGAIKVSDNSYLKSILTHGVPDKAIIRFPSLNDKTGSLRQKLGRIKRDLKDNRWNYFAFWKEPHLLLAESRSVHTRNFLHDRGSRIRNISFFDFYVVNHSTLLHSEKDDITELTEYLLETLEACCAKWGVNLKPNQANFVYDLTHGLLSKSQSALVGIDQKLKGQKLNVYIGNNSGYCSRLLSAKVLKNGGSVTGFAHGEPMVYDWTLTSWMELSFCSHYHEYTQELVSELAAMSKKHPAPNGNNCQYLSMGKQEFNNILEPKPSVELKAGDSVMVFGNFYRHTSYSSITAVFTSLHLYYELKVINDLKNMGYQVIYKMHPDNKSIDLLKGIFEPYATINHQRFNPAISEVDAFAFYYTGTTTFGGALASAKPILYFDMGISRPTETLMEKIKNRVIYVPMK